eukprot:474088-Alexandrium_andersonii.AAC.1
MSASLVGSEMCIRDRVTRSSSLSAAILATVGCGSWHLAFFSAPNAQAVSYTHLTLPTICSV